MTSDPPSSPAKPRSQGSIWTGPKRRKDLCVAINYAAVAWLNIQFTVTTFEGFEILLWIGS